MNTHTNNPHRINFKKPGGQRAPGLKTMLYYIGNDPLQYVKELKDLSIIMDQI